MEEEKVRLFVGGLAAEVRAGDLQERFAPLGNVQNITLPPAKAGGPGHRGFAYVDFVPKTDASLRKLFSAYNGCKWRGGKLRVEKAAEHYSDKLHREWAVEAASLAIDPPAKEIVVVQKSSLAGGWQKQVNGANKGDMEASDLKIFFPRLRKLKDVPLTGLGKHKRSFQRSEASPLQLLSYCGCAESLRFDSCSCSIINGDTSSLKQGTGREKDDISQAVEIERQRQLDLLNRLFPSDSTSTSLENQQIVELDDIEEKGSIRRESEQVLQPEVVKVEKKRKLDAPAKSSDLVENVMVGPRGTTTEPSMPVGEPTLGNQSAEEASKWAVLAEMCQFRTEEIMQPEGSKLEGSSITAVATSNKDEDIPSTEVPGIQVVEASTTSQQHTEAENNREESDDPSTSGQKLTRAAWKSLVGETGRVVFSLRQLTGLSLPQTPSLTQETQTFENAYTPGEPSLSFKASNHNQAKSKIAGSTAQKKQVGARFSTEPKIDTVELPKTPVTPIVSSSDVCPFMKSENAEKDWLATKSDLRSDYRAKQKYAARNDKKLWGKR